MKVIDTEIPDVKIIEPSCYEDERGWFLESWNQSVFDRLVAKREFVQDNHSVSHEGVVRGLHYQVSPCEQGKLVRVVKGSAFDVAVDIREGSKTYGKHVDVVLSEGNQRMLWIPEGFCHGFMALEDNTHFQYKATGIYNKLCERSLRWDSHKLNIKWPILENVIISYKDRIAPKF
jgi:dTDP-4-dehydrorhamnose 3,5-epimerase